MRIAVVTESFLPTVNGVTNSVRHVLEHLRDNGHQAVVIVPSAGSPHHYAGFAVHEVPAVAYRRFPVGLPNPAVTRLLADFAPDVIHAASPFLLGAQAIAAGRRLGIPSIAIFQTDVAGYARRNGLGAAESFAWRLVRWIHHGAELTLAPSTASIADLTAAGIERVARWGRGVDLRAYHPAHRSTPTVQRLRERLRPRGETVIGYVGRIAPEKQVERLAALRALDGIRLVVVGDGPSLPHARRALKGMPVTWMGKLTGGELAAAYASFDVFVHTGTEETFGQTVQEAHASGLPAIAPRAGGPIDLIEHGVDGYLFESEEDGQLRSLVERLAKDPALRAKMGEAGRRRVLGRSWDAVCAELVQYYEAVARVPLGARP
jgi:phosphatidylinositol alpha 1,6-mannosyltransferase